MPKIREYTNEVNKLNPTEMGVDSLVRAGRTIASNYNEAGQAIERAGQITAETGAAFGKAVRIGGEQIADYAQHTEIANGAAESAKLNDNITQAWNATVNKADPRDPSVLGKFRDDVIEPALEKYRDGFLTEGGQKFAEAKVEAIRNQMYEKTAADMATRAKQAVSVNMRETANSLSNTAMTDPSSVPHLLSSIESNIAAIVDSHPNLKGVDAASAKVELTEKMKEQIVKAGAIGAIQKSPDPEKTAAEWGAKYPQYINGAELKMLGQNAKQQRNADIRDQKWNAQLDKQAQQDRSDQTEVSYLQKLYSGDPKIQAQVSTKAIVNDPNLTRVSKERMVGVVERELKPETAAKVSNQNYMDVLSGIRSGKISDVDPIYEARQTGKLNRADFNQALKDFSEYKSPQGEALGKDRAEFFKRYAPAIDPSMGDPSSMTFGHFSALGSQKMYEAEKAARRAEEDARKSGKDPHSVYDPSSPEFFGRPENIAKFRAPLDEIKAYQDRIQKAGSETEFKPKPDWQYSASRNQYRDPQTGKIYSATGQEIK